VRVLHVNNTAGVATKLAQAQRSLGAEVEVLAQVNDSMGSQNDIRISAGYPQMLYPRALAEIVKGYDVVHWHGAYGRLVHNWHDEVASLVRSLGSKFLLHCHGSDVRQRPLNTRGLVLVSTPDILDFVRGPAMWIPNPVELPSDHWKTAAGRYRDMRETGMRVAYYPHRDTASEWKGKLRGLDLLSAQLKIIRGLDHPGALRELDRSHAFIASPDLPRVGIMEIEAALMELPVVSPGLDWRYGMNCPMSMAESLSDLLPEKTYVTTAQRQQGYASRVHEPIRVAKRVLNVYDELL
jgi:hypothetical protein